MKPVAGCAARHCAHDPTADGRAGSVAWKRGPEMQVSLLSPPSRYQRLSVS